MGLIIFKFEVNKSLEVIKGFPHPGTNNVVTKIFKVERGVTN